MQKIATTVYVDIFENSIDSDGCGFSQELSGNCSCIVGEAYGDEIFGVVSISIL